MKPAVLCLSLAICAAAPAMAQSATSNATTPIEANVDTGSHTCPVSTGWEKKEYQRVYAGDGRYFVNSNLSEISKFGAGNCTYNTDNSNPPVERANFVLTDEDGNQEVVERDIAYTVRAFADCTNNADKAGSRVGTACKFTAVSKRGQRASNR